MTPPNQVPPSNGLYQADFCAGCGDLLEDGVNHECTASPLARNYCTQCGKEIGHKFVCYPDARRRQHLLQVKSAKTKPSPLFQ